jgi:predicted transcriptional regulator
MTFKPTETELSILRILWELKAATVKEVQRKMPANTGYTTTLKFLQIMQEKGLVDRDESQRAHVYRTRYSREESQNRLLSGFMDAVFGGSTSRLVMQALETNRATPQELQEIRSLVEKLSGENLK